MDERQSSVRTVGLVRRQAMPRGPRHRDIRDNYHVWRHGRTDGERAGISGDRPCFGGIQPSLRQLAVWNLMLVAGIQDHTSVDLGRRVLRLGKKKFRLWRPAAVSLLFLARLPATTWYCSDAGNSWLRCRRTHWCDQVPGSAHLRTTGSTRKETARSESRLWGASS